MNHKLEALVNHREKRRLSLLNTLAGMRSVNTSGRKSLNIPVINIYDALSRSTTVKDAALRLNVSRGYIYKRVPKARDYLKTVFVI